MTTINIKNRIGAINSILPKPARKILDSAIKEDDKDWNTVLERLPENTSPTERKEIHLAYSLADWSDDNKFLMKRIVTRPELKITSLRDVARNFTPEKLIEIVDAESIPDSISGDTVEEKTKNYALHLHRKLYAAEPSAMLSRMAEKNELPGIDSHLSMAVSKFLDKQPDFNIRTTSIYNALAKENAFEDIDENQRESVIGHLKTLQRVQALSPVPEVVPHLMSRNLTSTVQITAMPESTFIRNYEQLLGTEITSRIYNTATAIHIRNENALMTMYETLRSSSSMHLVNSPESNALIKERLVQALEENEIPLSLENLFGDMDYCECDECLSVYSPAAYFVDLLQYLRHNNFGPDPANPSSGENLDIDAEIKNTPLGALFIRRPDLGCLELTCENTFTVLPYVDLVNEIMEHWVVKHAPLMPSFNVEDETSSELLAQPQHTNYQAYCTLKKTVYPFSLPYHQPIDSARIWLDYLGTSRYAILDTFRRNDASTQHADITLESLEVIAQDRAVDAEYLGMTQEEYIILTREAFWPKSYFDITQKHKYSDKEYQEKIGVREIQEYYGYGKDKNEQDKMLSTDEIAQTGLTFVKKQFLPRTGIEYVDLVEMLKTQFINPNYPRGKELKILNAIQFSYQYLQSLIDNKSNELHFRYAKVIKALQNYSISMSFVLSVCEKDTRELNLSSSEVHDGCWNLSYLRPWVYCYFEKKVGKLIVLESGEGPQLPIEGSLYTYDIIIIDNKTYNTLKVEEYFGSLRKDGSVFNKNGEKVAQFTIEGKTVGIDGDENFLKKFPNHYLVVKDDKKGIPVAWLQQVYDNGANPWGLCKYSTECCYKHSNGKLIKDNYIYWLPVKDTCDLEKIRLKHLDGTFLESDEYDRIQRFLRLWRKTGWTIDETGKALIGLSTVQDESEISNEENSAQQQYIDFDAFSDTDTCHQASQDDTGSCGNTTDFDCPKQEVLDWTISPDLLHQLVAVKKLVDRTGLSLPKLLTFWTDISTAGEKSLYARLFLTHNLLGIDKVFQADEQGNFLTGNEKITDHLPVLMAALRLKADEISTIMGVCQLPDALTLSNVSTLYRYSLLAKLLRLEPKLLPDFISLFGSPFTSAKKMLELLDNWTKMEDAGFSFTQLNYLLQDRDDARRPLAPSPRTVLQLAKTLYDGLNAIDNEHPDLTEEDKEQADAELTRTKAALVFEPEIVEQIMGLLEGNTVYTTNAPSSLSVTLPDNLVARIQYKDQKDAVPPIATLQVTGILTTGELGEAKTASADSGWIEALERVSRQAQRIISDVLYAVFPDLDEAKTVLLAGDVSIPLDQLDSAQPDPNTAPGKRFFFLQHFLPFLRHQLARRFIVETLAGVASLSNDITEFLLSDVLLVDEKSAMAALERIKEQPAGGQTNWQGYLAPAVNGEYTFIAVGDTQPSAIRLDGLKITFPHQQADPNNVWTSDPVRLNSGKLYRLEVSGQPATALQWKTATSPRAKIPASMLLSDYSSEGTEAILVLLSKLALLINGFNLTLDEVSYLHSHADDFDRFDFNNLTLDHWCRVHAYTNLRNSLPNSDTSLINLFQWACQTEESSAPVERITELTGWKQEQVEQLIAANHFDLDRPEAFRNETNLLTMYQAVKIANKVRVDIDILFRWAVPTSKFSVCHEVAQDIHKALRSRYDQKDWEQVVRPLNNQLRENQKQALISYLLVELRDWGVTDADGLFEFFLIDTQMSPCFETSRIKQAISSVQLFIQRCMLGMEEKEVPQDVLDRKRWEWMQRYRVWEANRKVFLYPENWILSQLRDDKSPFYEELESELLQKDINQRTVEDALKNYLYKVDEVANLRVVGLFLEQEADETDADTLHNIKLHIFARTRNAPYFFFYRFYDVQEGNWYPWEKVQVDIPSYDHETVAGKIDCGGTYLIPVVWNKRLLIFFPQFMKKTETKSTGDITTKKDAKGNTIVPVTQPVEYWEIKMGWSEYRNGKWTQKQLSSKAIYDNPKTPNSLPDIRNYEFVPRVVTGTKVKVVLDVYREPSSLGAFHFSGSQLYTGDPLVEEKRGDDQDPEALLFHCYDQKEMHSMQAISRGSSNGISKFWKSEPYFKDKNTEVLVKLDVNADESTFYHSFSHDLLGKLSVSNLDGFYFYYGTKVSDKEDAFGGDGYGGYHELKRPYALYNWEAAFHAPMLLVENLLNAQQFEQAIKMCHYIFDPQADEGTGVDRFWKFAPFKEIHAQNVLETLFAELQAKDKERINQVNEWRNNPFMPHVVARSRPSAYMKWVVMRYIEILIAWGDYLFRQDTIESINQATQLYVLASHIYGPRGHKIPKRGRVQPQTYLSLKDKWDAFSNAMVELELIFPFSNQTPFPTGTGSGLVGFANIFGFASTLYFCIPDNPKIRELRKTIDDRLFKIRNCQNIEGVFRKLSLFEPPIDPALLVQAAAQGLSLASVLNDLNSPMPNYRFYYLLQKAQEMCSELKALGGAYLSAKEKYDSEAISQLRAKHESSIHTLTMEIRTKQLEEAQKSLEALYQNRKGVESRMQYYLKLIGEDTDKLPEMDGDFTELPNNIEQPVDESGLRLSSLEKQEMDKAAEAKDKQETIGYIETLAGALHALPNTDAKGQPLGVGVAIKWGPANLANAAQAFARYKQIGASDLSYQSTNAGRKAGHQRQLQERIQQANAAGYEIKNIDRQILTQQIRINIAEQEITNQQQQIDNAQEMEDFLRNKYTNHELYQWMTGQITTLYRQAYEIAYSLAKKAENVYRFERGLKTSNFLQSGYWEPGRDGLLAGERLSIALKQLEAAYQEKRGYDYEISRSFSLRQISPLALIALKEIGRCEFALPEVLFDMDYPGHYMRRIKSVAMTVPCVVGPYTSLNCTLRLLEHKFRISSLAKDKNDYAEKVEENDERFSTVNIPITAIAVSTGQNDSGVFELNFRDERYIPFEGAGAISNWRIELPEQFRQFDYDTISDVVLHLRYTAVEGGGKLKQAAIDSVQDYLKGVIELSQKEGLFALLDLVHDFPNQWYKAMQPAATERLLELNHLNEHLPIFTKGKSPDKIQATDVYLLTPVALSAATVMLTQATQELTFTDGPAIGTMKSFVSRDINNFPIRNWQLKIQKEDKIEPEKLWMIVRYTMK